MFSSLREKKRLVSTCSCISVQRQAHTMRAKCSHKERRVNPPNGECFIVLHVVILELKQVKSLSYLQGQFKLKFNLVEENLYRLMSDVGLHFSQVQFKFLRIQNKPRSRSLGIDLLQLKFVFQLFHNMGLIFIVLTINHISNDNILSTKLPTDLFTP